METIKTSSKFFSYGEESNSDSDSESRDNTSDSESKAIETSSESALEVPIFDDLVLCNLLSYFPLKTAFQADLFKRMTLQPTLRDLFLDHHAEKPVTTGFLFHHQSIDKAVSGDVHQMLAIASPPGFVTVTGDKNEEISTQFINDMGVVLASSNGLLLLVKSPSSFVIVDPLSRKSFSVPDASRNIECMAVGFHCHGGYNQTLELSVYRLQLKFIRGSMKIRPSSRFLLDTYSSRTRRWSTCSVSAEHSLIFDRFNSATVLAGSVYWCVDEIVRYTPGDRRLTLIEYPCPVDEAGEEILFDFTSVRLGIAGDSKLVLVQAEAEYGRSTGEILLWAINDDADVIEGQKWKKVIKVHLPGFKLNVVNIIEVEFTHLIKVYIQVDGQVLRYTLIEGVLEGVSVIPFNIARLIQYARPHWPRLTHNIV